MNSALDAIPPMAFNTDFHQRFRLARDALAGNPPYTKTVQLSENDSVMKMTDKWSELEQT